MRPGPAPALLALLTASALLALTGAAPAAATPAAPLPDRMADTGGGTQLVTAVAPDLSATSGTLTWWERRGGRWVAAGTAPARFGARGLADGATRVQGTETTPTGLYDLPYAFGTAPAPPGTAYRYRPVGPGSWWCQDNASRAYNRWSEPLAADCAAAESERLADYPAQ